jgi:putative ABC transport system permease protein
LAQVVAAAGDDAEVVLEATCGWYWAADVLAEIGANIHLAHPLGLHWDTRRVKNDVRDANALLDMLRLDMVPKAWIAVRDYQLKVGDTIRLRLPVAGSGYQPFPFHVVGQISEFPTAPKDSFIVANAPYVSGVTRNPAIATYLVASSDPTRTASSLRASLGRGWQVQDTTSARRSVTTASGLAATDLGALAHLELAFSLAFAVAGATLALGLGIFDRRRALVVLTTLGASTRRRARFVRSEGATLLLCGVIGGSIVGVAVGYLLVAILRGIFDPPLEGLNVPAVFVVALIASVGVVGLAVLSVVGRFVSRASPDKLREL